jgi:hypothetical protein
MFKLNKLCSLPVIFFVFLLIFPGIILAEETLTITTYYPSPYGVYREMRAKRIAIGDTYYDAADMPWEEADADGGDIDYLADLVVEGNVGIGTTVPGGNLDVAVNTSVTTLAGTVDQYAIRLLNTDTTNNNWVLMTFDDASNNNPVAAFGASITDHANNYGDLAFATRSSAGWAEKMRILANGNVGIATSPTYQLDVLGPIRTKGKNINWNTGGIRIEKGDNTGYRWLYINSAGGQLRFYNGVNEPYIDDSGIWNNASDVSLKKDIIDLRYGLNEIMKLQPRSYLMKSNNEVKIGFIAQEVEKVIPEVVSGEEGKKGMSYGNLVSLAIKGIQEQQRQIEKQQQQIEGLKEELAGLKKEKIEEK